MTTIQVISFPYLFTDTDDVILLMDHDKKLTYYLKIGSAGVSIERYDLNIVHSEKTIYFGDNKVDLQYCIFSVKTSSGHYIDIPQRYDLRKLPHDPVEITIHPKHKYLAELIQVQADTVPYWSEFCEQYGLKVTLGELEPTKIELKFT